MTTALPILSLQKVRVAFKGLLALDLDYFELSSVPDIHILLMGSNGAGKTSLLNAITGYVGIASGGCISLNTNKKHDLTGLSPYAVVRLGVTRTFQTPVVFPSLTCREAMFLSWLYTSQVPWYRRACHWELRGKTPKLIERLMDELALSHFADTPHGLLPLPTVRRSELARCLATQPRLLFLDEPTAGADHAERDWLVRFLVIELPKMVEQLHSVGLYPHRQVTICVVTHDLHFVRSLRDTNLSAPPFVHVLDQGHLHTSASLEDVMRDPRIQKMYLGGG